MRDIYKIEGAYEQFKHDIDTMDPNKAVELLLKCKGLYEIENEHGELEVCEYWLLDELDDLWLNNSDLERATIAAIKLLEIVENGLDGDELDPESYSPTKILESAAECGMDVERIRAAVHKV